MPVIIRPADIKYKDSKGRYRGMNAVAERETAEIIADIEGAAAEQIAAVENAGTSTVAEVRQAVADSQAAVAGIDAQREAMIEAIASVAGQGTDSTFTQPGVAADAAAVGVLNSAINDLPKLADTEESDADLYVTDNNGYVIAQFSGGHIQTKNFDSSELQDEFDEKQDVLTFDEIPTDESTNPVESGGVYAELVKKQDKIIAETEDEDADLYLTDRFGYALAMLKNGGIETKKFKGFEYQLLQSSPATYTGSTCTLTVEHTFHAGDRIIVHVERGAQPWSYGGAVTYSADNIVLLDNMRGDNAYIEYALTKDANEITAVYGENADGVNIGDEMTLEVYLLGDIPIRPTVVTIKKDGSGDFGNLRDALDFIGTKASEVKPYRIEIYPGTYDVLEDYTDEEIAAAAYDQTSFVGPKLLNGMYLAGVGNPQDIILTAELDTSDWSSSIRGVISTLNCQGSCGMENLTVIAKNLRYCVHDDFHAPYAKKIQRIVKNCIFRGYGVTYTPGTTWGGGTPRGGMDCLFENCDFGENGGVHTNSSNMFDRGTIRCVNCCGRGFRIGDSEDVSPVTGYTVYRFENCNFTYISQGMNTESGTHVRVTGCGGSSPLYRFAADMLYETGDVVHSPRLNLPVGTVVEWYTTSSAHGPRYRQATSAANARGIVVWNDGTDTYIQYKGYVRTNRTSLTNFNLNDYVGVSNGETVVVANEDDAFGKIVYIDGNGQGYIKLLRGM